MDLRPIVAFALVSAGCLGPDCAIEAYVDDFFDDHDAIDCRFAHQISSYGETSLVGAEVVRECIADALANRKAFVGGYLIAGIDSSSTTAFLGDARGSTRVIVQSYDVSGQRSMSHMRCSSLAQQVDRYEGIGFTCLDGRLEPLCGE